LTTCKHLDSIRNMKLLRAASVAKKLDMHKVSVFRLLQKDATFPKPLKLSSRYTAWVEEEIDQWLFTQMQLRRSNED
jgi:predicted DNA-binding transcriptional regulator AlpA